MTTSTTTTPVAAPAGTWGEGTVVNTPNGPLNTGGGKFTPTSSPTVVSDANTRETTIPNINQQANGYINPQGGVGNQPYGLNNPNGSSNNGSSNGAQGNNSGNNSTNTSSGGNGKTDYSGMSYEDIYNNVLGQQNGQPVDPVIQSELDLIKGQSNNADAVTASQIAAIQNQYQSRYADTVLQQKGTTAGLEQTLNLGGSSRYAPVSSSGILSSKEKYDLQTLNDLQATENTQIASLKQAQVQNDYKAMSDQLALLDKTRQDKITLAQNIASNMSATNKDTRDKLMSAQADAAKMATENGAPASVIAAINSAQSPSDAYAAASGYGGGANVDVEKITNTDGSQSIVRVDKNTGKILGTTNVGGGTPSGGNGGSALTPNDYNDFITGLTPAGATNFNKLTPTDQSSVKQLINGDALLSDLFTSRGAAGGALRQQILQKAQSVDPNFSENTNKIRYNFMQNWTNDATKGNVGVRTAINTGLGHLADFKENTDALDKGSLKTINSATNWWAMQTSDPNILKAQTDVAALAGEIAKAYNEDTVSGIDKWTATLGLDFQKGGISAVQNEVSKLLTSKITALRYTYKTAMGKDYNQSVIDPDKKQALLDAGIDPANIAKESIPGQPKSGIGGQIDTALSAVNPDTGAKYTPDDIITHLQNDPTYGDKIKAALSAGWSAQDILNYLNQ